MKSQDKVLLSIQAPATKPPMTANKQRLGRIQSFTSQSPPLFYHSLQLVKEALNCFLYSDCPAVTTRSVAVIGIFAFTGIVISNKVTGTKISTIFTEALHFFPYSGSPAVSACHVAIAGVFAFLSLVPVLATKSLRQKYQLSDLLL